MPAAYSGGLMDPSSRALRSRRSGDAGGRRLPPIRVRAHAPLGLLGHPPVGDVGVVAMKGAGEPTRRPVPDDGVWVASRPALQHACRRARVVGAGRSSRACSSSGRSMTRRSPYRPPPTRRFALRTAAPLRRRTSSRMDAAPRRNAASRGAARRARNSRSAGSPPAAAGPPAVRSTRRRRIGATGAKAAAGLTGGSSRSAARGSRTRRRP